MDARQQVLQEISALETQVENFSTDMDRITATEPLDQAAYEAIKAELNHAQEKLDAKREELESINVAGQAMQEHVAALVENIVVPGVGILSFRDLTRGETEYEIACRLMQQSLVEQAERHARELSVLKSSYDAEIADLKNEADGLKAGANEATGLRIELAMMKDRAEDAESKRDAAARQNEELKADYDRVRSENERLREEISNPKPVQTNINADLAELARKALEAKPAVYNKRDQDRNNWVANLVETDEEVVWPKIYPGKYREVTAEEADSFRAAKPVTPETEPVQEDSVPDMALVGGVTAPELQFQTEEVSGPIPTEPVDGTMVLSPEELTRRLLALEQRVDQVVGVNRVA